MAIKKHLISNRFPYLPIKIQIRRRVENFQALIDTGFDGDVAVPKGLLTNGDIPDGYTPWELADGSRILAPAFVGRVQIKGIGTFSVAMITLGDEVLIGRGLTDRLSITFDHGKRVIVEL